MRRFAVVFLAVTAILMTAFMEKAGAGENDFEVTLSSRFLSAYVMGAGVRLHGPVYQHTADILYKPWGVYITPWQSVGLNDAKPDSDSGDEIDINGGFRKSFGRTGVDVGGAYFLIHPFFGPVKKHVVQLFGEVSHAFPIGKHVVAPFLRLEYSMRPPGSTGHLQRSVRVLFGASHSVPLFSRVALYDKAWVAYDSGGLTGHDIVLAQGFAGLDLNLGKGFSVGPFGKVSVPISHTPDGRKFELVGGMTSTYSRPMKPRQ